MTAEHLRLDEARDKAVPWKQWGPYLSERQWGTVREDYSESGDAWNYFSHDQARSRAYRWGEDGLAGISDDKQRLCFALALWNGKDPILKERLFGLTNSEGNHGEDVKEYYFYLDSTPTHSYMKYLYKYPQAAFPYEDLVETNRRRGKQEFEYELLDTGVFDQDRYFDVFVEYAKESPRGSPHQDQHPQPRPRAGQAPRPADPLVPQLMVLVVGQPNGPCSASSRASATCPVIAAEHPKLGEYYLYCDGDVPLLFTENETNTQRLFGVPNRTPYVKDGINNYVVLGQQDAVNPGGTGTKASAHYQLEIRPGGHEVINLRLTDVGPEDSLRVYGPHGPFGGHYRRAASHSQAGGRRVLRGHHATRARPRCGGCHASGAGGDALVEAVLPLRRGQVARGARVRPVQADSKGRAAQRSLAPHVQRRRDLHAGQVGVSLVRGLGPRLPRARP